MKYLTILMLVLIAASWSVPAMAADSPPVKSYKELSPEEKANYERLMKELEAAKKQNGQSAQPASGR